MQKIFLISLLLAPLNSLAQISPEEKVFKEVNPPNFLVHNQLSPEIFKLEYTGGITKGTFKNTDGVELNRFSQNTFTVSDYPLTLISKRQQQLYVGFGYVQNKYVSFDTETPPAIFQEAFQSIYLNVFLNTRIKNRFYWFFYLQGGVNGTHPFDEVGNSFNVITLNKINY